MSKKSIKLIISGILAILFYFYIIGPIIETVGSGYTASFNDTTFSYLLSDSVELKHNPYHKNLVFSTGRLRETDQTYFIVTNNNIFIEVFEYYDLDDIDLDEIKFSRYKNFPTFEKGISFNDDLGKEVPVVTVKNKIHFNDYLEVGLDKFANLNKITGNNFIAFEGDPIKMSLNNKEGEAMAMFDFSKVTNTLLILYKKDFRFLLIIVTSEDYIIDKNYLKLFKFYSKKEEIEQT